MHFVPLRRLLGGDGKLLQLRAISVAALMIGQFGRGRDPVATCPIYFSKMHVLLACPEDARAFVEAFDMNGFALQEQSLAIVGDKLVEGDPAGFAVHLDQITLVSLAALVEAQCQGILLSSRGRRLA